MSLIEASVAATIVTPSPDTAPVVVMAPAEVAVTEPPTAVVSAISKSPKVDVSVMSPAERLTSLESVPSKAIEPPEILSSDPVTEPDPPTSPTSAVIVTRSSPITSASIVILPSEEVTSNRPPAVDNPCTCTPASPASVTRPSALIVPEESTRPPPVPRSFTDVSVTLPVDVMSPLWFTPVPPCSSTSSAFKSPELDTEPFSAMSVTPAPPESAAEFTTS